MNFGKKEIYNLGALGAASLASYLIAQGIFESRPFPTAPKVSEEDRSLSNSILDDAKSRGVKIVRGEKKDLDNNKTWYSLDNYYRPSDKSIHVSHEDVLRPFVSAHEVGHFDDWENRSKTRAYLGDKSRWFETKSFNFPWVNGKWYRSHKLPHLFGYSTLIAAALGAPKSALLAAGLTGSALSLPSLYDEARAGYFGRKRLKEKGVKGWRSYLPYGGLMGHSMAFTMPLTGYASRLIYDKIKKD